MKNPHEPGTVTAFVVLYLLKDVLGTTPKRMVKDGYAIREETNSRTAQGKKALEKKRTKKSGEK